MFPSGIFKNFQIHIPVLQSDSADEFSNNRQERKNRKEEHLQSPCSKLVIKMT